MKAKGTYSIEKLSREELEILVDALRRYTDFILEASGNQIQGLQYQKTKKDVRIY